MPGRPLETKDFVAKLAYLIHKYNLKLKKVIFLRKIDNKINDQIKMSAVFTAG